MAIGNFTDRHVPPTQRQIETALGPALDACQAPTSRLEGAYAARGELRFYGANHGCAARDRRRGRALAALYPNRDGFTVQVILSDEAANRPSPPQRRPGTAARLQASHSYAEGRWVVLPVEGLEDAAEIEVVLEARASAASSRSTP